MTKIIVRKAKLKDFNQLTGLFKQLQPKVKLNKKIIEDFFRKILKSKSHFAWVAIADKQIVGYMDVVIRHYYFAFDFTARIETAIVDENYRRQGIATKLIKACEEQAKKEGCKIIELDSAMHRKKAHKFYKANGFTKRGFLFWKKLKVIS